MSHYEYTEVQRKYLRKRAQEQRELEDCCNCIGDCDNTKCDGFTRKCLCDNEWTGLNGIRKARETIHRQRPRQQLGTNPEDTN